MLGKLIGVAFLQGDCLPGKRTSVSCCGYLLICVAVAVRFTIPFLKQLLQQPLKPADLEAVDPTLYKNKIQWVLQSSKEELQAMELTFTEEETVFGATKVIGTDLSSA